MNDPFKLARAEHREAKRLLNLLAETEEGDERDELLATTVGVLYLHMAVEEENLYPLVEVHLGREKAEEATIEHELTKETVEKLRTMASEPGFGAVVEMLKGGLTHHIKEEESEIFPQLQRHIPKHELGPIGDAWVRAKGPDPEELAEPRAAQAQ